MGDADVAKTLPHLLPTVAAMVRLQRLTGMRPGEVTTVRVGDLDRSDPACWAYRPARHKSEHHERERVIFVGPRAQEILRPYLEAAADDPAAPYLFDPRRSEAGRRAGQRARRRSPLTPSQRARAPKPDPKRAIRDHYDVASYRRAIRRACLKAGLSVWFPHQLRHTAATEIRRRYGLEASQAVLGHAELGVTQVYAEADMSRARAIMAEAG